MVLEAMKADGSTELVIGNYSFAELGRAIQVDANAPSWILEEKDGGKKTTLLRFFGQGINGVKVNELTYVQELVAQRNRVVDKLRIEVSSRETFGITKGLRKKMNEYNFEINLTEAEMAGAQYGLNQNVSTGNKADYRAIGIIDQALKGDELRWSDHNDEFNLPKDPGRPMNELVIGSVILLWTEVNGQKLIYVQKEKMAKPEFDKKRGDSSLIAETRKKGETIKQGADRGLYEEAKLRLTDIALNPMPIGYFQFPPNKKAQVGEEGQKRTIREAEGPWIVAFSAYLHTKQSNQLAKLPTDEELIAMNDVGPRDGETFSPGWKTPEVFMSNLRVRGAMLGIVEAYMTGKTRIIQQTSRGRR